MHKGALEGRESLFASHPIYKIQKIVFNLIYDPCKFQVDICIQSKSMAFGKVRTFIPIWGAIWVFPPWRRGGAPKTPHHIINFAFLGVNKVQQH